MIVHAKPANASALTLLLSKYNGSLLSIEYVLAIAIQRLVMNEHREKNVVIVVTFKLFELPYFFGFEPTLLRMNARIKPITTISTIKTSTFCASFCV